MPLASRLSRTGSVAAMAVVALALAACSAVVTDADRAAKQSGGGGGSAPVATAAPSFDLTTKNLAERPHTKPVAEAVQALEQSGFRPVQAGKLTVALGGAGAPPTSFFAEDDAKTIIGSDPDLASLIAEGLGLEYAPENVAWADWPLGIESGKYDLALTNIGVTEERKELFDFATYRDAVMGFVVADGSAVERIAEAKDVSGLKIVVGSGTNQEKFLLDWIAQNRKAGLPPGEAVYFDDFAAGQLALKSGRVDASILPYSLAKFQEQTLGETRVVGKFNSAYPVSGEVGTVSAKGSGLAKPVQIVIQHLIDDGTYAKVLQRWGQSEEAVRTSQLNPPGLPKP